MSKKDEQDPVERKAKQFLEDAYSLESESDAAAFYERWADDYDAQVEHGLHYVAPGKIAGLLSTHLGSDDGPILDVGCGTGLTGACLRELGHRAIDGIDLSAAMLDKAREKAVYRRLMEADLNAGLALADAGYAAVVSSGTFTMGHVGPEPIDELLRVLVPEGVFACTVHGRVWDAMGFSAKFEALERAGTILPVERYLSEYFEGEDKIAWYCVYGKARDDAQSPDRSR